MKHFFKFSVVALAAMTAGLLNSCTENEALTPDGTAPVINLLKAPDVIAYSGSNVWGSTLSTRGTDMNANMWNQTWDCPPRPAEDLTPEELAELKDLLSKGKETHNKIVLPFENYYVQQIYKGEDRYNTHDRCYNGDCDHVNDQTELGSGHMDKLVAWNPSKNFEHREEDGWKGAWYTTEYEHVNNFNNGTNTNKPGYCGCGENHFGTTLMTGMPTSGFDPDEQFGFHETWGTDHNYNNYIIVEYKGYYYVGFDYEAHKPDQGTHNHGEGLDIERDWNFTDWIVRITPAFHKGQTPEDNPGGVTNPEKPEPGNENCEACGHPSHGDTCGKCEEGGVCNPAPKNPETPETPDQPGDKTGHHDHHTDEVEVNLAAQKREDGSVDSHLSIHVRAATDVEIFIPIPDTYFCQKDDLLIVESKYEDMVHGGLYTTEYKINGIEVTLKVEYIPGKEGGIRIWTDGINEDVIKYCLENYGDGITFEVWTYFEESLTDVEELEDYLNKATIRFLAKEPKYYINAFGKAGWQDNNNRKGKENVYDCTVSIHGDQVNDYTAGEENQPHLNGSDNNVIYTKK